MNPLRHDFIAFCLADTHPPSPTRPGLNYLDIGCGGGIFAESLARTIPAPSTESRTTATQAASITALDPSSTLIKIARDHARMDPAVSAHLAEGRFQYLNKSVEEHLGLFSDATTSDSTSATQPEQTKQEKYDIVTLFEVLEHIDPSTSTPLTFLSNCLRLLKPGGWLIGSTIARTIPSFIVNQVIAEAPWPIGVVPRGTHEWGKFVNPDELRSWAVEGLGRVRREDDTGKQGEEWRCAGAMYFPGFGWKIIEGSESWGNYFWAIRRGDGSV